MIFLRKFGQPSEIYFEDKVVGLADIIDNQYVIRLAKPLIPKVNMLKNPRPKIWHAYLSHLSYEAIQKLASIALNITLNSFIPTKICGSCMVSQQQHQPS